MQNNMQENSAGSMLCILCILQYAKNAEPINSCSMPNIVLDHDWLHPWNPALDPSSELIGVTMVLIQWYNLYRRRYPPKDEFDIQDLAKLGDRCEHISHILHIEHCLHMWHIIGIWNNVKLFFHLSTETVIQSWPLGRITAFDIPLEMLHDIVMLSM